MTFIPEACNGTCGAATSTVGIPGSGNGRPCTCPASLAVLAPVAKDLLDDSPKPKADMDLVCHLLFKKPGDILVKHIDTNRNKCWVLFTAPDDPPPGWYPCSAVTIR